MGNFKFAKKHQNEEKIYEEKWKLLIVDDEPEVHTITKSVLKDFVFEHKRLEFISAYSGTEAIEKLTEHKNIAVILLDVVMESDDAGLRVVKQIRDELQNGEVRIILRTGQPGMAPEREVILNYDINDYKEKTELTSTKLFSTIVTAIRSYKDICTIKQSKEGLKKIINASRTIFQIHSLELFVQGVLTQLVSILNLNHEPGIIKANDAFFAVLDKENNKEIKILTATGKFKTQDHSNLITSKVKELFDEAIANKKSFFKDDYYIGYFESSNNSILFLYIEGCSNLSHIDKNFINIFSNDILVAYENILLHNEIINTQKELILRLGAVIENRSEEVAGHVKRVAKISYLLAIKYGLDEEEARRLEMASPMHDIGKVAILDDILLKPSRLAKDEFEIMKKHTIIGYDILKSGQREILKTASIIAREHHERWDGTGYPRGLKGEEIHIYGRITAIADVFDALTYKRVYKQPWPVDKAIEFIKEGSGSQFDPKLVNIFLENIDEIKNICGL